MIHIYKIGSLPGVGNVWISAKLDRTAKGMELSFSGVEGPTKNGDCRGGCGQIIMEFVEYDPRGYLHVSDIVPAEGWDHAKISRLFDLWDRWHLNGMRAGCAHQKAEGWEKRPIDQSKPTTAYGKHFPGQVSDSWNMLTWVTPKEHPEGLLTKPCPVCGYRYGSEWLYENIPTDVLSEIDKFPEATEKPAWI